MVGRVHLHQPEGFHQAVKGQICRPIVYHNNVDVRVIRLQSGADGIYDHVFLIPRRNDDGYRWSQGGMAQGIQTLVGHLPDVNPGGAQREQHQDRVNAIAQEKVREGDEIKSRDSAFEEYAKVVHSRYLPLGRHIGRELKDVLGGGGAFPPPIDSRRGAAPWTLHRGGNGPETSDRPPGTACGKFLPAPWGPHRWPVVRP